MYLKKISIKNFRVFDDQGTEVIFNKGVNAIIGENNSGKSALIDAIRIAFTTVPYSKDIYFTKSDFYTNSKGERAETAQFDIYLDEVPNMLIEIWDPESPTSGEFHLCFYTVIAPSGMEKVKYKAWGGKTEGNPLSPETFDAINIAFLGALRDAENEMRPSRSSKLASLLSAITMDEAAKTELVDELFKANRAILTKEPIKKTKDIINSNLLEIEQELLYQQIEIGLVEPNFESIASSLRSWIVPRWFFVGEDYLHYNAILDICSIQPLSKLVQHTDGGIYLDINSFLKSRTDIGEEISLSLISLIGYSFELHQNGLGYNNLLFMSAVLGDMSLNRNGIHLNLFTVEEPEAHLHPQLQELIHSFFDRKHRNSSSIQVIYTTHSPTLVSRIGINSINLLFEDNHTIRCYPLASANLEETDQGYLEKYLDVTKSQMFFAKGILFVEGICEAVLLPEMAKMLNRPFDKFAVEMVNVDGTAFKPFAKILALPTGGKCFAKAAILTDDDRCTDKDDQATYIAKDLDFDDDLVGIHEKIQCGNPSARFKNISELCTGINVELCGANKTLEYELALQSNNVPYLLDAINSEFPQVGIKLKELVDAETTPENQALRIWLFIRARNSSKGQVAQALCRTLQKQVEEKQNGVEIERPFIIPPYIAKGIYAVTEPEEL